MRNVGCYWWFSIYLLYLDVKMGKNVSTLYVCHLKLKVQWGLLIYSYLYYCIRVSHVLLHTVRYYYYYVNLSTHNNTFFFYIQQVTEKKPSQNNSLYNDNIIFPQWQIFTSNCALSLSLSLPSFLDLECVLELQYCRVLQLCQPATELASNVRRAYFCALRIYSPKITHRRPLYYD